RAPPLDAHCGAPGLRTDAERRVLDRRAGAHGGDVGLHAVHECPHDLAGIRRIARPLEPHVAAVLEQAREAVTLHGGWADHLREAPLADAPPHLHLPEPVLRRDIALSEDEILLALGF